MRTEPPSAAEHRRVFRFKPRLLRWPALALAVALAVALVIPTLQGSRQTEIRDGLTFAAGDLQAALDDQLVTDQRPGSETRVLLSFSDDGGTLCRAFVRADLSGIACRRDSGWHLRLQRDGVDVSANDSRQAVAVETAVLAAARNMAAGPALDPDQERAVAARGWTGG